MLTRMPVDEDARPADEARADQVRAVDTPPVGRRLRFQASATTEQPADTTTVVLDTTWTKPAGDRSGSDLIGVREVAASILARRDLIAETFDRLDDWAEASRVVADLTIEGTSIWYGDRLQHWLWLLDACLWLAIVDELLAEHPGVRVIQCAPDSDVDLVEAARSIAQRDGLVFLDESAVRPASEPGAPTVAEATARTLPIAPSPARSLLGRLRARIRPSEPVRRRRAMSKRLHRLARERQPRLLAVLAHARQTVETPAGPRSMNAYLGPVIDRLRGTRLDPVEVDIRMDVADDAAWLQLGAAQSTRLLSRDVVASMPSVVGRADAQAAADAIAERLGAGTTPLVVSGVDVGPALTARVAMRTRRTAFLAIHDIPRIRALLRHLRPAGILLADEYHRQDWMAAAAAEGVPTVALQHGVIYRWHNGYIHRTRPDELRLPDRTYVFGAWERALLTETSVYRPDEVVVGGSPRLDLVEVDAQARSSVRTALGVAPGDRLVVLSGTWGRFYRRFLYPIALAGLFAGPIPRLHLVVKLHPAERDDGPYRTVIENVARANGFASPPITSVQAIDLYRLLAAADRHLGIHSTLLTEAVVTGTPNLLASGLAASDLLGYVQAGVATPVTNAQQLAEALDLASEDAMRAEDRAAFMRDHFEPGAAGQRIADDLLSWLR